MNSIVLRPAQAGDGAAVFAVTHQSISRLGRERYSSDQLLGWMGERTPEDYERSIAKGGMVVACLADQVVGFVDAEPGEVTRLFVLEQAAGQQLGSRLLQVGIEKAQAPGVERVRVESTLNAEGFYQRHGFVTLGHGVFSHGVGGAPIAVVTMERPVTD
ncbi:GNAT family N-acetyltransferase [Pseudomonas sp. 5P_5.1_Bac1]|uniref:GNAT family N-acetyltransferase n=1 Tax=Pseudomonas sp. 5P_5.1_Bac1 TaxID=2971616 RepID=UPI0021C7EAF2|nr:GNAT family N-acetyltransferase [Pseudomonas sp. 5P_5.1_Bac1]MCU1724392.1 GNAT family N-acetyltransferase [Pseudomonas sp. 5P_5.1_Bac1]